MIGWQLTAAAAEQSKFVRSVGFGVEYTLYIGLSSYLGVLTHEYGHALAAKSYGATDVTVEAGLTSGVTSYYEPDEGLSDEEDAVVSLAGNSVNRMNAGWSNLLHPHFAEGTWPSKFFATFYLVNRGIVVEEWIRGIYAETADFYKAAEALSSKSLSHDQIYALFGLAIAADIWWSWRTIMDNGIRFAGNRPESMADSAQVSLVPLRDGLGMVWRSGL